MAVQVSWEGCNVQLADLQLEIALQFIATTYLAWRGQSRHQWGRSSSSYREAFTYSEG